MKRSNWIFICIIILAAGLRLFMLSSIPNSLNIDEQALGYNAYSLLKTGLDEHGKFFPISLESYGDWKLIGYPLLAIPFIALIGLNELSVRLPSAFAGVIQVILIYFLAQKLFQKKGIALLASFLLAVSPWSIYFSRMAYEVNLATAFLMGGLLAFLHALEEKTKWSILLSCTFFAVTLFIYHSFVIFTPLFCLLLFMIYFKKLKKNIFLWIGLAILVVSVILVGKSVFFSSSGKLSSLAVWNDTNTIYSHADIFKTDGSSDKILGRIFYSKPIAIISQIGQNYLATFSPVFLFQTGGEKLVNSLGYFGNFYLLDAILLLAGLIGLAHEKNLNRKIFLLWLLVGIFPSAITRDAPSSTRLFLILPLFILVMAYGGNALFKMFNKNMRIVVVGLIVLYVFNIIFFLDAYFLHINYQKAKVLHYGFKQIVALSQQYPQDDVVVYDPQNFPYMSFLFYLSYDPNLFRKHVIYYPKGYANFDEVKSFGRYHFVDTIDYTHLEANTLYIDYRGIRKEDLTINLPDGKPEFKYFFKDQ